MAQNNPANTEQELNEILRLRREKLAALKEAGSDPYTVTKYDFDSDSETIKNNFDEFEGKTVKIAGRIMSRRIMGKASFVGLADCSGKIQLYVRRDDVGEEEYAAFKNGISAILSALRASFSKPRRAKFRCIQRIFPCFQSHCCPCPKNSTV